MARRRRGLAVADLPLADGRLRYDVGRYCDVDPLFGDLASSTRYLHTHARDLRVLLDWIPFHTADQHPWLRRGRASRTRRERGLVPLARRHPSVHPPTGPASAGRPTSSGEATGRGTCTASCPTARPRSGQRGVRRGDARRAALLARPRRRQLPHRDRRHLIGKDPDAGRHPRGQHRRQPPRRRGHARLRAHTRALRADAAPCSTTTGPPHDRGRGRPHRRSSSRPTSAARSSCTSPSTSSRSSVPSEAGAWRTRMRPGRGGDRRALADVGALRSRPAAHAHAPRRLGDHARAPPCSSCSRSAARPSSTPDESASRTRDVSRPSASSTRRARHCTRRPSTARARPRWPADPWLPWPARARRPQRRGASAPTMARSCTWRGRSSRCAGSRRPCTAARSPCSTTRPRGARLRARRRRRPSAVWVNFGSQPVARRRGGRWS